MRALPLSLLLSKTHTVPVSALPDSLVIKNMAPWSSRGSAGEACPLGGLLISQEFDFCALYVKSPINYAVRARTTKVTYIYYLLMFAQGTVYFK